MAKLPVPTERSERREAIGPMLHCCNEYQRFVKRGSKNNNKVRLLIGPKRLIPEEL